MLDLRLSTVSFSGFYMAFNFGKLIDSKGLLALILRLLSSTSNSNGENNSNGINNGTVTLPTVKLRESLLFRGRYSFSGSDVALGSAVRP